MCQASSERDSRSATVPDTLDRFPGQHGLEDMPVDVPAVSVWVSDEVVRLDGRASPRRPVAMAGPMPGSAELLPDAHAFEHEPRRRRQGLPDLVFVPVVATHHHDSETGPREPDRRRRARGASAHDRDVERLRPRVA